LNFSEDPKYMSGIKLHREQNICSSANTVITEMYSLTVQSVYRFTVVYAYVKFMVKVFIFILPLTRETRLQKYYVT